MKKIKIGIIGTGGMANHHADQFKKLAGVELTSCLDVVPGRAAIFAEKHGVKRTAATLEQLLEQVDAVTNVTPDRQHAEVAIAVLQAGRHLLTEKPLTVTLEEARQVARAARAAQAKGVMHLINFSYRNSYAFHAAAKLVADGALGEIRHVTSRYLQSWLTQASWGHWTGEGLLWRLQTSKGSGGVLGDLGCHILDFTTGIAGELKAVRCTFSTFPKIGPDGKAHSKWQGVPLDANDTALIELHFASGAVGQCHTSRWATGHANTVALEVHGTEGALRINLDEGYDKLQVCLGADRDKMAWQTLTVPATPSNYERLIRAIRTGQPEQADVLRGAQIQAYLDACQRSAAHDAALTRIRSWE